MYALSNASGSPAVIRLFLWFAKTVVQLDPGGGVDVLFAGAVGAHTR